MNTRDGTFHGHDLPEIGSASGVIFADGCVVTPQADGSWLFTPSGEVLT